MSTSRAGKHSPASADRPEKARTSFSASPLDRSLGVETTGRGHSACWHTTPRAAAARGWTPSTHASWPAIASWRERLSSTITASTNAMIYLLAELSAARAASRGLISQDCGAHSASCDRCTPAQSGRPSKVPQPTRTSLIGRKHCCCVLAMRGGAQALSVSQGDTVVPTAPAMTDDVTLVVSVFVVCIIMLPALACMRHRAASVIRSCPSLA